MQPKQPYPPPLTPRQGDNAVIPKCDPLSRSSHCPNKPSRLLPSSPSSQSSIPHAASLNTGDSHSKHPAKRMKLGSKPIQAYTQVTLSPPILRRHLRASNLRENHSMISIASSHRPRHKWVRHPHHFEVLDPTRFQRAREGKERKLYGAEEPRYASDRAGQARGSRKKDWVRKK